MPNRDGTGPAGQGSMTGKKMGNCGKGKKGNRQNNKESADRQNSGGINSGRGTGKGKNRQ